MAKKLVTPEEYSEKSRKLFYAIETMNKAEEALEDAESKLNKIRSEINDLVVQCSQCGFPMEKTGMTLETYPPKDEMVCKNCDYRDSVTSCV